MTALEKANRVLWRVKMQDELDLAATATDPEEAARHRQRASELKHLADQDDPPDTPLDPNLI
jgi:hypothetical protein